MVVVLTLILEVFDLLTGRVLSSTNTLTTSVCEGTDAGPLVHDALARLDTSLAPLFTLELRELVLHGVRVKGASPELRAFLLLKHVLVS